MTQETLKALTDSEISQVIAWGQAELAARMEQRKQDAIAKIRELAATVGVTVAIDGVRGRPRKARAAAAPERATARRTSVGVKTVSTAASAPPQAGRSSSARPQ
jgi:hypothetical protein